MSDIETNDDFVGVVAVDTGRITIGDPCYLEGKTFESMQETDWTVTFQTDYGDGLFEVYHPEPGVWLIFDTTYLDEMDDDQRKEDD